MESVMKRVVNICFALAFALLTSFECAHELIEPVPAPEDKVELADPSNADLVFSGDAGECSVVILANVSWTAASDKDWCTVSPSEGQDTDLKIRVSVAANSVAEQRTATVTVKAGASSLNINVCQLECGTLSVKDADFEISEDGGTFDVELAYNVAYEVTVPDDVKWIRELRSKAISEAVHTFEVDPNEARTERTAVISFTSEDGRFDRKITVLQKGQPEKELVFQIWHGNLTWKLPEFEGKFVGMVDWGDESSSEFGMKTVHAYTYEGEKAVTFSLIGEPEDLVFTLQDIIGVTRISLETLR